MADINLSLDDLIKKNKQTKARPAKTAPKKAAAKPVTKSTAGRGRGRGRGAATAGRGRGATVGGVARNPRAAVTRAPFKPRGGLVSAGKRSAGVNASKWSHDKFDGVTDLRQKVGAAKAAKRPAVVVPKGGLTTGTKVTISNLDTAVTQQDMKDLFETIGPLKSAKMTAVGMAEVVFKQAKDANTAFAKYNNVVLDGRPMVIAVAKPAIQAAAASRGVAARTVPAPRARANVQPVFHVTV